MSVGVPVSKLKVAVMGVGVGVGVGGIGVGVGAKVSAGCAGADVSAGCAGCAGADVSAPCAGCADPDESDDGGGVGAPSASAVIGRAMLATSAISTSRPMNAKRVCAFMIPPERMFLNILGKRTVFINTRISVHPS